MLRGQAAPRAGSTPRSPWSPPAPSADPGDHGTLPQLFIVLGNDRANRFWAARLPTTEAITPDSSAEQRRDFITRKYREGRYRLPHPHYTTQEEVLQVGDTSRCWEPPQNSWCEVPAPPAWLCALTASCQADFGRLCPGLAALEQPWGAAGVSMSQDLVPECACPTPGAVHCSGRTSPAQDRPAVLLLLGGCPGL